ncbi:MAG: hypothetical protein AAGJ28_00310 [Pseudomonadota bacterium]
MGLRAGDVLFHYAARLEADDLDDFLATLPEEQATRLSEALGLTGWDPGVLSGDVFSGGVVTIEQTTNEFTEQPAPKITWAPNVDGSANTPPPAPEGPDADKDDPDGEQGGPPTPSPPIPVAAQFLAPTPDPVTVIAAVETPSLLVNTNEDVVDDMDGLTSLREALDHIANGRFSAGSTIEFDTRAFDGVGSNNTITLRGARLDILDSLTIDGDLDDDGTPDITIDANNGSQAFYSRGIRVTIDGLIIENGRASEGAGIYHVSGGLRLLNSTLNSNDATRIGGGIASFGALIVENSTITKNDAALGGGLFLTGAASLSGSIVAGNEAKAGRGISPTGGGIYAVGNLTLYNAAVVENTAGSGPGGGIYSTDGDVLVTNTTIANNTAEDGAGIQQSNTTSTGTLTLINATVSGNVAVNTGGGLVAGATGAVLYNSLIVGNSAATDAEVSGKISGSRYLTSGTAADIFAAIDGTTGGGLLSLPSGIVPVIELKSDLSNPALDAGDDRFLYESTLSLDLNVNRTANDTITADAAGRDRLEDFPGLANNGRNAVDLGAAELQLDPASLTVDTDLDNIDLTDGLTSLREAILFVNSGLLSAGSTIEFADGSGEIFENGGTIRLDASLGTLRPNADVVIDGAGIITITGDSGNDDILFRDGTINMAATKASNNADTDGLDNDGDGLIDGADTDGETLLDNNVRLFFPTNGNLTLDGLILTGGYTTASGAAAHSASNGALVISDSVVRGNYATGSGGGVFIDFTGSGTITGSQFSDNIAGNRGGGLSAAGTATVYNSSFTDNTTSGDGGGIATANAALTLTNVTLAGNSAKSGGGLATSSALITNATITGNTAVINGGGIEIQGFSVRMVNSIVLGNTGATGTEIYGTLVPGSANNLTSGSPAAVFDAIDSGTGGGQLADNGGGISTVKLSGDIANPALDAGNDIVLNEAIVGRDLNGDGLTTGSVSQDAAGAIRIIDIPGLYNNAVSAVDLGALELQPDAPSLVVNTNADGIDLTDGVTTLREAIRAVEIGAFAPGATIEFDSSVFDGQGSNNTITLTGQLAINDALTIDGDLKNDGIPDVTIDADSVSRAFRVSQTDVVFDGLVITGGDATGSDGGGVLIDTAAKLALQSSQITGNTADAGGGLYVYSGGELLVLNSIVDTNVAGDTGGGILNAGSTTVLNSALYLNEANVDNGSSYGGGAIANTFLGDLVVTNTTFVANTATNGARGGGIDNQDGHVDVTNATFDGNTAATGGAIFANPTVGASGVVTISNSLLTNNTPNAVAGGASFYSNSIFADYVFSTGTLALNGGAFVPTLALAADLRSSALDGGDDSRLSEALTGIDFNGDGLLNYTISQDAAGNARISDFAGVPASGTNKVDIGAFEVGGSSAPSLRVNSRLDNAIVNDGLTTLREAIEYINKRVRPGFEDHL